MYIGQLLQVIVMSYFRFNTQAGTVDFCGRVNRLDHSAIKHSKSSLLPANLVWKLSTSFPMLGIASPFFPGSGYMIIHVSDQVPTPPSTLLFFSFLLSVKYQI